MKIDSIERAMNRRGPETVAAPRRRRAPGLLKIAAFALVVIWLFPVYLIVLTSFEPEVQIAAPKPTLFITPTIDNYRALFTEDADFGHALSNSSVVSLFTCFFVIVLAIQGAYALSRMEVRGEKSIALWILSMRFIPPIAVTIPFYLLWQRFDLLDTRTGLVIVYVAANLPFAVWLLRGFLAEFPKEIEEAALLDGLSRGRILLEIIVPVVLPGIAVTAIFTFMFTWNEYLMALILTSTDATTGPIAIARFVTPYQVLWGNLMAATMLQLLPILLVVFLLQRHILRGMTMGAVK